MKKLKKIGLIFLLIGAILFASCSNNSDGSSSTGGGSSTNPDNTQQTTTDTNNNNNNSNDGTQTQVKVPQKYKEPVTGKTAAEIIEMMGPGWNLGNTLDAARVDYSDNKYYQADEGNLGVSTEESWGMPKTTKAMIDVVAAAGFSHVRAPVSWHNHVDASGNIEAVWLARVKEIVDWIIGDGMFCVINIHHDTWDGKSGFWGYSVDGTHETESIAFVEKIWEQVADYFKNYDQRLAFETLNEPRVRYLTEGDTHEWGFVSSCETCKNAATTINTLNKKALDKIRAGGGKNNERLVIVPPYVASPDAAFVNNFVMPTDSVSNLLAISVHAYQPYNFAMKPDGESNFTSSHEGELNTLFTNLANLSYPVFIGEFSATNRGNSAQRVKWAKYYVNGTSSRKMAYCLWDNNDFDQNKDLSERHGHLNRNTLTWYDEDFIKAVTGKSDLTGGSAGGSSSGDNGGGSGSGNSENIPEGATALGLTGIGGNTDIYTYTNTSSTGATIEVVKAADGWKTFSVGFTAGKEKITMKIKNDNTTKAANVRFDLLDNWTTKTALLKTAKKDTSGLTVTSQDASGTNPAVKYVQFDIPAGETVSLELTMENTATVLVCYFNSSQASGGETGGKITISEAYLY